ncbi:MAG: hypothetical protein IKZ88_07210 [Neisseriaceae bacterium]|nr:hypothetical protein [Neisseriaceae bacterium]
MQKTIQVAVFDKKQYDNAFGVDIVVKLQNNNALARLAVLFILSAARRLLFF